MRMAAKLLSVGRSPYPQGDLLLGSSLGVFPNLFAPVLLELPAARFDPSNVCFLSADDTQTSEVRVVGVMKEGTHSH